MRIGVNKCQTTSTTCQSNMNEWNHCLSVSVFCNSLGGVGQKSRNPASQTFNNKTIGSSPTDWQIMTIGVNYCYSENVALSAVFFFCEFSENDCLLLLLLLLWWMQQTIIRPFSAFCCRISAFNQQTHTHTLQIPFIYPIDKRFDSKQILNTRNHKHTDKYHQIFIQKQKTIQVWSIFIEI